MSSATEALTEALTLSVIIPAHDEESNLGPTVRELTDTLRAAEIPYEVVVVNDNSSDATQRICDELCAEDSRVRCVRRTQLGGFGRAIRAGLAEFRGDVVVIMMADCSDDPKDVVRYYRKIDEGYDCVFGSRFRRDSEISHYPPLKRIVNRIVNRTLQLIFWTRFNDLTNAFKAYRREVIQACGPYSSSHFNLTIEMSLSALIRRYHIAEIPIRWTGRTWGASSLSIPEMGRRYLSVVLKMLSEKILIGDDILEERLADGAKLRARAGNLEERVGQLEDSVTSLQKSLSQPKPGDSTS